MQTSVLERLDLLRFRREGEEIHRLLAKNQNNPEISLTFKAALQDESELFQTLRPITDTQVAEKVLREYLNHFTQDRDVYSDESIDSLFLPVYCAEVLEDTATTKILVSKLDDLSVLAEKGFIQRLQNQPYRLQAYLELYLTKYLEDSKVEDYGTSLKKFESLLDVIVKYFVNSPSRDINIKLYDNLHKANKSLLFIILWRAFTLADVLYEGLEKAQRKISFLLGFCNDKFWPYFGDLQKQLLLYSLNQTILPLLNLRDIPHLSTVSSQFLPSIPQYISFFIGATAANSLKLNLLPSANTLNWEQFVVLNFLLMHHINSKRANKKFKEGEIIYASSQINLDDIHTRILPFVAVNLNEIKRKIKRLSNDVKDHKYLTLFTGFLMEYFDLKLVKGILEESIAQPFDDKQIIKTLLCYILYLEGEYLKSYQFVYQILERERINEKNTFVITLLGSLLCLKHLDKPEEALVFAKSNLDYSSKNPKIPNLPLRIETLYACAGYCNEALAANNPFFIQRMDFYVKAIEYFELSREADPTNGNVLYHLSLLYATIHEYDKSYQYVKESIKAHHHYHMDSYLLLILISTALGDYKKAGLIIEEILPDHKHPLLYVFRVFLEIENVYSKELRTFINDLDDDLTQLKSSKKNQELDEAQVKRELIQEAHILLRSAAICILNSSSDEIEPPAVVSLAAKYQHQEMMDYQNLLLLAVEAFIKVKDYSSAEIFLDLSKMKNVQECEYLYYKGLLCELREEYNAAEEYYKAILLKTSTFYKAYLHLGIIHSTVENKKNLLVAKRELEEALRYEETPEILYYIGKLYEEQGDVKLANQYVLKSFESSYRQPILPFSILPNKTM